MLLCALCVISALIKPSVTEDIAAEEAVYVYCGEGGVEVSAVAAAMLEAESGRLLFARNANTPLPMASTTKIMTAVCVLENAQLDKAFTVPKDATEVEGSSLYLRVGEVFTVEELLYGLMLESGNDAAIALAIATSGDVEGFVKLMNAKAEALGLKSTRFANPNGLPAEGHYTTAEELARLTAYALSVTGFEEICSTRSKVLESDGHITRYLNNHNKLLGGYAGMIGVKTGYTAAAGRCLVTAARRDGMTLVAVTLNDRNDWADHRRMLDYGFGAYRMETVCTEGESIAVPVAEGKSTSVFGVVKETVRICIPTDASVEKIYDIKTLTAPVKEGQLVGKIKIYSENTLIKEVPLCADRAVDKKRRWLFF